MTNKLNSIYVFFKPTKSKILVFVLLFLLTSVLSVCVNVFDMGFPLHFYEENPFLSQNKVQYFFLNALIDMIIWYLISCLIEFIMKRKSE